MLLHGWMIPVAHVYTAGYTEFTETFYEHFQPMGPY